MATTVANIRTDPSTPNDVYIGRKAGTRHFGNPFRIDANNDHNDVLMDYFDWLLGHPNYDHVEPERRKWILSQLPKLRNKRLMCYCSPLPCHADILADIADNPGKFKALLNSIPGRLP